MTDEATTPDTEPAMSQETREAVEEGIQQARDGEFVDPPDMSPIEPFNDEMTPEVRLAYAELRSAEKAHLTAKDIATIKKKSLEICQTTLNGLVGKLLSPAQLPLPLEPPADWHDVALASLTYPGIGRAILDKLADHTPSITTLGELAAVTAKGDWWAKDIAGIGPEAAGAIDDATAAYWVVNRQADESKAADADAEEV